MAGVVAGAALAHFRWIRDRESVRRAPHEEKRREACDGLWRVIEQSHVAARTAAPKSGSAERELIADVNTFAMVNGVYIDDADRQLAQESRRIEVMREELRVRVRTILEGTLASPARESSKADP